jgi:hypothetical protein
MWGSPNSHNAVRRSIKLENISYVTYDLWIINNYKIPAALHRRKKLEPVVRIFQCENFDVKKIDFRIPCSCLQP